MISNKNLDNIDQLLIGLYKNILNNPSNEIDKDLLSEFMKSSKNSKYKNIIDNINRLQDLIKNKIAIRDYAIKVLCRNREYSGDIQEALRLEAFQCIYYNHQRGLFYDIQDEVGELIFDIYRKSKMDYNYPEINQGNKYLPFYKEMVLYTIWQIFDNKVKYDFVQDPTDEKFPRDKFMIIVEKYKYKILEATIKNEFNDIFGKYIHYDKKKVEDILRENNIIVSSFGETFDTSGYRVPFSYQMDYVFIDNTVSMILNQKEYIESMNKYIRSHYFAGQIITVQDLQEAYKNYKFDEKFVVSCLTEAGIIEKDNDGNFKIK